MVNPSRNLLILSTLLFFILSIFIFFVALASPNENTLDQSNDLALDVIDDVWEEEKVEPLTLDYYYNFDLYYSSAGAVINLTGLPVPDVGQRSELTVYKDLLKRSYIPQFLFIEASINLMPIVGTYIREKHLRFYQKMDLSRHFNAVESATIGFEEPYALSIFLNNMVTYSAENRTESTNRGFMGYLISTGNFHIQRNRLVKDNWWQIEWKMKGDIQRESENLSWSFRVGGKFHDNQEITDLYYITLRRSQLTRYGPILSWIFNSGFEYTHMVSQTSFNVVEAQLILSKKIPSRHSNIIFSFDIGLIHSTRKKYSGSLQKTQSNDVETILVLRPMIEF